MVGLIVAMRRRQRQRHDGSDGPAGRAARRGGGRGPRRRQGGSGGTGGTGTAGSSGGQSGGGRDRGTGAGRLRGQSGGGTGAAGRGGSGGSAGAGGQSGSGGTGGAAGARVAAAARVAGTAAATRAAQPGRPARWRGGTAGAAGQSGAGGTAARPARAGRRRSRGGWPERRGGTAGAAGLSGGAGGGAGQGGASGQGGGGGQTNQSTVSAHRAFATGGMQRLLLHGDGELHGGERPVREQRRLRVTVHRADLVVRRARRSERQHGVLPGAPRAVGMERRPTPSAPTPARTAPAASVTSRRPASLPVPSKHVVSASFLGLAVPRLDESAADHAGDARPGRPRSTELRRDLLRVADAPSRSLVGMATRMWPRRAATDRVTAACADPRDRSLRPPHRAVRRPGPRSGDVPSGRTPHPARPASCGPVSGAPRVRATRVRRACVARPAARPARSNSTAAKASGDREHQAAAAGCFKAL